MMWAKPIYIAHIRNRNCPKLLSPDSVIFRYSEILKPIRYSKTLSEINYPKFINNRIKIFKIKFKRFIYYEIIYQYQNKSSIYLSAMAFGSQSPSISSTVSLLLLIL